MRLVNVEVCKSMGIARSNEEAATFAQVLDEANVILLFRNKVYLHPDKVEISLNQHLCREAKIGPKAHKFQSVLVSDLVVMGILGFGFKTHAHSILTGVDEMKAYRCLKFF